jgi:tetratricopeptide (TPR) repeat protein
MKANILIAVALAMSANARADHGDAPGKARELAEQGRIAHQAGDYGRAIEAFREAYVIAPAPALLFNLAQSYRLHGSCDDAAALYRRYLGSGPDVEARALAETHLATVERCVRERSPTLPLADPMTVPRVPVPSGDHAVIATPPRPARGSGQLHKTVGLGVILGGTAALGIATYYGFRAHDAAEDVERAYAAGGKWKDVAERDAEGRRAATTARILGVGGGLAVLTGVTLVIVGKRTEPLAITPSSSGVHVSYTWKF